MRQDNEVLRVHCLYMRMLCEYKTFKIEPGFRKMEFKKECYAIAYIILKFINKNKCCIYL